jgi:O-antigen ligase
MTAILLIAALCALVWGTYLTLHGSLVGGCLVYLILVTCFANEFLQFDIGPLTWTLDRLFLGMLVATFCVQWRLGKIDFKRLSASEYLLAALLVLAVLSTFTHDWRAASTDVSVAMRLANGFVIPAIVYFIARQAKLTERNVSFIHAGLAVFGLYLAVTAILEITGQWGLVFPRYIADPNIGIHFGRARGPALQSSVNGSVMVMCLGALWVTYAWQMRASRAGVMFAILLVPLFAAAVYFTYTRSVWLGAAVAGTLVLALTLHGRWRPLVLGGLTAVALLAVVTQWESLVAFQREDSAAVTRESTYMRASFAYVSLQMFKDRPLWGFGFGQFPRENRVYLGDRRPELRLESIRGYVHHNTPLCILVEMGLIGLLVYLALFAAWARNGWRLWRNRQQPNWVRAHGLVLLAGLACYTAQMIFHDVTYSPIDNTMLYLLAGLASGLQATTTIEQRRSTDHTVRRRESDMTATHPVLSDVQA